MNRKIFTAACLLTLLGATANAVAQTLGVSVNNSISVNSVDLELESAQDEITLFDEAVLPLKARVKNTGMSSYLRVKIDYFDEQFAAIEPAQLQNLSAGWLQAGDYYYFDSATNSSELIDIFDGALIPESWRENQIQTAQVRITAEAIQGINFTPDFSKPEPWGDVTILANNKQISSSSQSKVSKVEINYDGNAAGYVVVPDDFFGLINNLVPGDIKESGIQILDQKGDKLSLFASLELTNRALAKALQITMLDGDAVLYAGDAANLQKVAIADAADGRGDRQIRIRISLPAEVDNALAGEAGDILWRFSTSDQDQPIGAPNTFDSLRKSIIIMLVSIVGLCFSGYLGRRQNNEDN